MKYVYWDACCFISLLKREATSPVFESILIKAEAGEIVVVTSAISIFEVNRAGLGKDASIEDLRTIGKAFDALNGVMIVDLTRDVAELAREAVWKYGLKNYDATHLGTALYVNEVLQEGIAEMHSIDGHFTKLNSVINDFSIITPSLEEYPLPQPKLPGMDK